MQTNQLQNYRNDFDVIYQMIENAQSKIYIQVNTTLITLYWEIGNYVSNKIQNDGWGKNIVEELAKYIFAKHPTCKGFSARNIWRMKQFYEAYRNHPKLSAVLTEISWTNHLHVLSKTKSIEEKEFYFNL